MTTASLSHVRRGFQRTDSCAGVSKGCQTPFRKRRPRALCGMSDTHLPEASATRFVCSIMTGGPGLARDERATCGWIRRWVSGIPVHDLIAASLARALARDDLR